MRKKKTEEAPPLMPPPDVEDHSEYVAAYEMKAYNPVTKTQESKGFKTFIVNSRGESLYPVGSQYYPNAEAALTAYNEATPRDRKSHFQQKKGA